MMFLLILLCSPAFVLISANNVIPVQTYPIYQANGFMNPPVNQPSNIQTYIQGITDQNQLQQLNISPSTIKQAILNKLLTGSPVQVTQDSNIRGYNSNLSGFQNNQIPRNLVNNNVVVPEEYLKHDRSNSNIGRGSNNGRTTESSRQSNRKKSKSRKRQSDVEQFEDNLQNYEPVTDRYFKNIDNTRENLKKQKKSSRKPTIRISKQDDRIDEGVHVVNTNIRPKRRKIKETKQTTEIPIENIVKNTKPQRRRTKQKENDNIETKNEPRNQKDKKSKPKQIKENVDLDITRDGMDNENRQTRNSKHEVNDLMKSVPNTPKDVTNHFFPNLKQFNNPMMGNWLANYENLYQSLVVNQPNTKENRPKRKKKPKRNRKNKKKKNSQNKNSTVDSFTTKPKNSFVVDSANSKNIYINQKPQKNLNTNPMVETFGTFEIDDKNMRYSSNEIFRDGYSMSDFEDRFDNGYYEGYIDDYYPMFTDNAAYTANNKEIILKNLNDNKYYYATDKLEPAISKKHQKNNDDLSKRILEDYEKNKHTYDEIEIESIKNAYENEFNQKLQDETQFHNPFFLETPDFLTRQIDRNQIKPEIHYTFDDSMDLYINDKSSSYSSAKTPYHSGGKQNKIKMQPKDVETVYAKSKVVAYGPVYMAEDSSLASSNDNPWVDHNFASDSFQIDGTTYVVAKSMEHPELY